MPRVFYRNYLIFTAILLACVAVLAYLLAAGDHEIEKSDDWVTHTHKVIIEAEELNTLIAQMVSSQRGYLVSGDEKFLEEYQLRKAAVSMHVANLFELTDDNASQQSRLQEIQKYFMNLSDQLEATSKRRIARQEPKQVLDDVDTVKALKNDIYRINGDFLVEEYELLNQRIQVVENLKNKYFFTLLIGGVVSVVLLLIFNAYLLRAQSMRSSAETALSEREEVFRLAMEGTNDGVFDWNLKTDEVFYSRQFSALLGYEPEEFEGTLDGFKSRVHPEDKEQVMEHAELYKQGQLSEYSHVFRMQHKGGRWVWIHARANLIRDKNGRPVRMVGAHTDVSASKEYELRLREEKEKAHKANRAKSEFLAHMSHEIRTPLTTISGVAEILQQNKDDLDDKKQNLVRVLYSSAITLKDLISDVLDFSKIESGELELDASDFELQDAFEHIVSIMSVKTAEKELEFVFDYNSVKHLRFFGDPVRLRQILINLIGNAVKFTEKGHVHVTARRLQKGGVDVLQIDVEDTGIGLSEDQIEKVFEQFKQADASVSRKYGGTGLGLPISKNLASLMGGDIVVESEPNKGSIFSLIIPFRDLDTIGTTDGAEDYSRVSKINDKLKAALDDSKKVLMVEDYEGNIVVIGHILEEMGLDYDVATTGLEALNKWKENHYDLVLMDIQMPEMDGFTATEHIRQIEEEQNISPTPIIGMTAHALVGDKDRCIECGMDAYLPKPVVETDLKLKILKYLQTNSDSQEVA